MKDLRGNSMEPAGIKTIVHLLNTDYDMIVSVLTFIEEKLVGIKHILLCSWCFSMSKPTYK